jgi:hypothetical protein
MTAGTEFDSEIARGLRAAGSGSRTIPPRRFERKRPDAPRVPTT